VSDLPLQIKMFNDRVRVMNSSNSKILTLNAQEARALHAEIYDLMATIATLSKPAPVATSLQVVMDGGGFK
jgi:hypothetical protein